LVNDASVFWRTDPATLRDVAADPKALENALASGCPPIDRIRFLTLLNREDEALQEGFELLNGAPDRAELLLILAEAFQHQYRWHEAAQLHEEALQLASTRVGEAYVRHHIGRRLFDEARYRDAAAEFQWAADLYRVAGEQQLAQQSTLAMKRAQQVHAKDPHGLRITPQDPLPQSWDASLDD
jgi:tetratricopeptide (TPR) repeat protein